MIIILLLFLLLCNSYLGNIYIADSDNQRIRKVTISTGIITTYAGTGSTGFNSDNVLATSSNLYQPADIALDSAGIS